MNDLVIGNVTISQRNQLYRLNDLHKAAGGLDKDKPVHWLTLDRTKDFIDVCRKNLEVGNPTSHGMISSLDDVILKLKNGQYKGTYVSRELVYSYAMWVSPDFAYEVIKAYDRLVNYAHKYDAALERFKKEMLLEVPSDWRKLFTDDFYVPVCRLWNIRFQGNGGGLPYSIAQFTLNWVYRPILPKEVFDEIKQNRSGEKMHQWFSDGGKQRLIHHLMMVSGIAKTCRDYSDFKNKAGCVFSDAPLQLEMF
jgi:KilA-N domain/P63C domain